VEISLSEDFLDAVGGNLRTNKNIDQAIGYLATWAIPQIGSTRYSGKVTIYGDKEGNLNASYRDNKGEIIYSMAAIRNDDGTYSTHS
jgi:hypothetical protein